MIFPDANLLLYAEDAESQYHEAARHWWDTALSGSAAVCLCWEVINAYLRIGTNPRIHEAPLSLEEASGRINSWLDQPCVRVIHPLNDHWKQFCQLLMEAQATANLVPDAHLAALCKSHGCTLYSSDHDFAKFTSIKWVNPLRP
ncbi:MAG: TA system VapC family ribonuclease toxin [Verrucomicrobiota bacterium]